MPFEPSDHLNAVRRIGALIRDFHDASAEFTPPANARWNVAIAPDAQDLIVHHDLAPWNLVCGATRWVFIDWDGAGPGSRMWDLAYAAHGFLPLQPNTPVAAACERLTALAEGYRLDEGGRQQLADLLTRRIMSMHQLLHHGHLAGIQPWARLWSAGHGTIWRTNARYTEQHLDAFRDALTRPR
jgi:thiamine kinase-like enzyme